MNLHQILMEKAAANKLAHFYILESALPEAEAHEALVKFTHEFIREYYQKVEKATLSMTHLMDHPDVYVMGNLHEEEKETKAFTVEESEEFARFFEFRPVQGKRKFAVITEAHRINVTVANKWLKLLEEPQGNVTIFLLNPRRQKLLETIHSRALHLRLPVKFETPSATEWNEFLTTTKGQSLSEFIENHSKADKDISFWSNEWIRWEAQNESGAESKNALQDWLKKLQEMEIFHQPTATKWTLFYSVLQEHVLKRNNH